MQAQANSSATGCARVQRVIAVLWPSFLISAAATTVYFMIFDPREVWPDIGASPLAMYTVAFFACWGITATSSALTCYFRRPCPRPAALTAANTAGLKSP